jgi:hypothetical protein
VALITTTKGMMDESELRKVSGSLDNDNEYTTWQEYYLGDELVHRSVQVNLKRGADIGNAIAATF